MQSFILSHQDRHTDDVPRVRGCNVGGSGICVGIDWYCQGSHKSRSVQGFQGDGSERTRIDATVGSSSFVSSSPVVTSFEGARISNVKSVASRRLQPEVKAVRDALPLPAELRRELGALVVREVIGPTRAGNRNAEAVHRGTSHGVHARTGHNRVHTPSQHYPERVKAVDCVSCQQLHTGTRRCTRRGRDRSKCTHYYFPFAVDKR